MTAPLSPEERDALRRLAEKATPDHWEFIDYRRGDDERDGWFGVLRGAFEILDERFQIGRVKYSALPPEQNRANAQYIAAANPQAILALLDDHARLTVALQAATEEARHFETDAAVYLQAICSARYELSHPRTARDADRADAGLCEAILQVRDARDARSLPTEDTKR